jgi:hypothetical protein
LYLSQVININCASNDAASAAGETSSEWHINSVLRALRAMETAVDIRRDISKRVSAAQRKHYSAIEGTAPSPTDNADDAIGITGKDVSLLSFSCQQEQGVCELELAGQHLTITQLTEKNTLGPKPKKVKAILSTIENYLVTTEPQDEMAVSNFMTSSLTQAAMILPTATQLLRGMGLQELYAKLTLLVCECVKNSAGGNFDAVWLPPPSATGEVQSQQDPAKESAKPVTAPAKDQKDKKGKGTDAVDPSVAVPANADESEGRHSPTELTTECIELRAALLTQTTEAIQQSSKCCFQARQIFESCETLVNVFGNSDAAAASAWLLQLQSLNAREYLFKLWRESLNPRSEVSSAVSRLLALEQRSVSLPTACLAKQVDAEIAFLAHTSSAWRRLAVTADPASILTLPLLAKASLCFVCLQVCPRQQSLFLCAGLPAVAGATAGPYKLPGTWVVDKIPFTNAMKQQIAKMKVAHSKWREDASKLIAVYGR